MGFGLGWAMTVAILSGDSWMKREASQIQVNAEPQQRREENKLHIEQLTQYPYGGGETKIHKLLWAALCDVRQFDGCRRLLPAIFPRCGYTTLLVQRAVGALLS
jgi:hypothetical protein